MENYELSDNVKVVIQKGNFAFWLNVPFDLNPESKAMLSKIRACYSGRMGRSFMRKLVRENKYHKGKQLEARSREIVEALTRLRAVHASLLVRHFRKFDFWILLCKVIQRPLPRKQDGKLLLGVLNQC
jgi:hypothetical protein